MVTTKNVLVSRGVHNPDIKKTIILSEHFNEPIQFFEDRRKNFCNHTFMLDAKVRSRSYQFRKSGLWRIYFDNLDDAVELEFVFFYLHYCFIGDTYIYPFSFDDIQLSLF